MKIRKGYVSNSSSSSFLVAFPKYPKSVDDVHEILFGKNQGLYELKWPTKDIAKIVFDDIKRQVPNNINLAKSKVYNAVYDRLNEFRIGEKYNIDWQEYKACNNNEIDKFMDENKGSYCFVFTYADEDGDLGADMEHGSLFDGLPYLRSSNH
jgi:hypothetical protein